jgi:periplasmic protein TonB
MTLEDPRVPEPGFGSLQSCLVEGDPQSKKRARRIKQRAVAVSIALQTLALAALVLFPLLSKGERMDMHIVTPVPPYHHGNPPPANPGLRAQVHVEIMPCHICPPNRIPNVISRTDPQTTSGDSGDFIPGTPDGPVGDPNGNPFGAEDLNPKRGPVRPIEDQKTVRERVSERLQMAQLINRVEPAYPRQAIQARREGRVELHAIIATDGTMQSLEVLSGDPFFIQSALSAVRQWRYRPTILNGRPVEIDTHITVIYTLNH